MSARLSVVTSLLLCLALYASAEMPTLAYRGSRTVAVRASAVDVSAIPHSPQLKPVRGWTLSSRDADFGGLSGLAAGAGGFLFVSDAGLLVRMEPDLSRARLQSLPRGCAPHELKRERDSESLARDPETGTIWIGLEYRNLVCRIGRGGKALAHAPRAMARWPRLGGPEAMLRRDDGHFLVFAERPGGEGSVAPLLAFDRDPADPAATAIEMEYEAPAQYHPVDAAMLPDGRMLVLHRRFAFPLSFSAIVTLVEPFEARPGLRVSGRPVIVLAPPGIAENFEGLTVDTRDGRTRLWLVSDDNFLPEQRIYLLEFELRSSASSKAALPRSLSR